jgi:hypothetical protein
MYMYIVPIYSKILPVPLSPTVVHLMHWTPTALCLDDVRQVLATRTYSAGSLRAVLASVVVQHHQLLIPILVIAVPAAKRHGDLSLQAQIVQLHTGVVDFRGLFP